MSRIAFAVLASLAVIGLAGCFECEYPVAPLEKGKVDLGYVGDWILHNAKEKEAEPAELVLRNLHNDEYYVEFGDKDGDRSRATGYLTKVGNTTFASVLPLKDDGTLAPKHSIWRIDRKSADEFTIRGLNPEFFKDKKIESSDDLRKLIAANLKDDAMYTGDPIVAKRDKAESSAQKN